MSNEKNILIFRDVSLKYSMKIGAPLVVFENLSFSVYRGQKLGFWGPSGSGKSSLFYLASGFQSPSQGSISMKERAGLIHQQAQLNPWLTCKEILEMEAERGNNIYDIMELLEVIDMKKHGEHLFMHLSGGEKQRIALAATLASGAKIILADEPYGRVDSKTAEVEKIFMRKMIEEHNLTLLLASHYNQHFKDLDGVYKIINKNLKYYPIDDYFESQVTETVLI
ncbi:MAG: Bicarbonate transport ATP-binding protein CmpD [Candidatus Heimdallarchaeota archaeon LC_3]|nr:MAG: Bicarbonate transport ATP-binding protein CmpD [Candidatus Heimdallarchaeota archaeon LC_3]